MCDKPKSKTTTATHCQRRVCGRKLTTTRWRIWNLAGANPPYRDYCRKCGEGIISYNRQPGRPTLRYEVIEDWSERVGRTEDRLTKLFTVEFYDRPNDALVADLIEETGLAEDVILSILNNWDLGRVDMPEAFTRAIYGEKYDG